MIPIKVRLGTRFSNEVEKSDNIIFNLPWIKFLSSKCAHCHKWGGMHDTHRYKRYTYIKTIMAPNKEIQIVAFYSIIL